MDLAAVAHTVKRSNDEIKNARHVACWGKLKPEVVNC